MTAGDTGRARVKAVLDPTNAPQSTKPSHGRGMQFVHDASVAGFLTLLTVIAYDLRLFSDSDGRLFAEISEWVAKIDPHPTEEALILEIDQSMFEKAFGGRNPLDRTELAKIIEAVPHADDNGQPFHRTLAIDLDLSPRGEDLTEFDLNHCADFGGEAKNRWPIEHALCSSALTQIVLLAPFPTDGKQAVEKLRWMTFVCGIGGNVDFALAYIPPPVGSYSVEYYTKASTLAGVVAGQPGLCRKVLEHASASAIAHAPAPSVPIDLGFLIRAVADANQEDLPVQYLGGSKPELLNFRLDVGSVPLSSCVSDETGDDLGRYTLGLQGCGVYRSAAGLRRTALFLGGTWDATGADEFFTPLGRLPGLRLHAIAYAGRALDNQGKSDSIQRASKLKAVIIEFAFGLGLVWLFRRVWHASDRALDGVVSARKVGNGFQYVRAAAVYLCSVLAVPAAVVLIASLLLGAVAVALSSYVWMAPTALLVSLLAKSYIERPLRRCAFASSEWRWQHVPHLLVAVYGLVIMVQLLAKG